MLPGDALVCPRCGAFVHRQQLEQLANQAMHLEQTDPAQAARIWQQCLPLIPPTSSQYQNITQRIAQLSSMQGVYRTAAPNGPEPAGEQRLYPHARPQETFGVAAAKTLGSMAVSALIYAIFFHAEFTGFLWAESIYFAVGFVILMLVHEMGHVFALRYYGLRASPPIFIPFLGAIINLRQSPPDALAEAVVGMGGPFLGTIGAIACFWIGWFLPQYPVLMSIAFFGFILNLFNLLPVPPLDGGRITAALSPWLWLFGLLLLAVLFIYDWMHGGFDWILLIILVFAWPRIRNTLRSRHRDLPYYQVPKAGSYAIGIIYVGLGIVLIGFLIAIHNHSQISVF